MGINQSYQWAIETCNKPNVGYSQAYRNQQTVNGITYYDCSSFINYSLNAGGYETPNYAPNNNAFITTNMGVELMRLGAKHYPTSVAWKEGDILVNPNHCEMVYKGGEAGQGGITMGAHTDGIPLADQVSINSWVSSPNEYVDLYRLEGGIGPTPTKRKHMPIWMMCRKRNYYIIRR